MKKTVLYYDVPAKQFTDALPLGNGRTAAMMYGGVESEQLQLNEESLWTGYVEPGSNKPVDPEKLKEIQNLLFAGKIQEASELADQHMVCTPGLGSYFKEGEPFAFGHFTTAGRFFVHFDHGVQVTDYSRSLDIAQGIATVDYNIGGRHFTREAFASIPANVVVMRVSADDAFSCDFTYERRATTTELTDDTFHIRGSLSDGKGLDYALAIRVVSDGKLTRNGCGIRLNRGRECVVYIAISTNYLRDIDPLQDALERVDAAVNIGWEKLRQDSTETFSSLAERAQVDFGGTASDLPVNKRLERLRDGSIDHADMLALYETYWKYGFYLSVASSYNSVLPTNVQGIWAEDYFPIWSADYHLNINLQMFYWPTEPAGLTECTDVLMRFIKMIAEHGRDTAKIQYNCRGWVAHTATNPWGFTALGDETKWGTFMCGGAWICQHIWERWLFGGDVEFLREYYPLLRGASEFFVDFLVRDPNTGYLVTAPSNSPENAYLDPATGRAMELCAGPTIDNSILYELFTNTAEAAGILGMDDEFAQLLLKTRDQLPPLKIGKYGQIMEWQNDYEEPELGHRHLSMLYALHPSNQMTKTQTPELCEAAKVSLARRVAGGGGATAWSRAWITLFYARLGMGNECEKHIRHLLDTLSFNNLFSIHPHTPAPVFQIDGNLGGCAGITEMLLQSHDGFIELLPALPDDWMEGSFRGLKSRGGFVMDASWKNGLLTEYTVTSQRGGTCEIRWGEHVWTLTLNSGESHTIRCTA